MAGMPLTILTSKFSYGAAAAAIALALLSACGRVELEPAAPGGSLEIAESAKPSHG